MTNQKGMAGMWNRIVRWINRQLNRFLDWITRKKEQPPLYSPDEVKAKKQELEKRMQHLQLVEAEVQVLTASFEESRQRVKKTEIALNVTRSSVARKKLAKRYEAEQLELANNRRELEATSKELKDGLGEAWQVVRFLESAATDSNDVARKFSSWLK